MKCLATGLDIAAAVLGLVAAWFWFEASRVEVKDPHPPNVTRNDEPGDFVIPTMDALQESAKWNKIAALITGLAVIIGALANLTSQWPFWCP